MLRPIMLVTLVAVVTMGAASCGGDATEPTRAAPSAPSTPPPAASPSPSTSPDGEWPFSGCDHEGEPTATCRKELDAMHRELVSLRKKVRSRPNHVALTYLIKQADTAVTDFRDSPCSRPNAPTDMSPAGPDCAVQQAFLTARWTALQAELNHR